MYWKMHPPGIKRFAEAGILCPEARAPPLGSLLLQYCPWGRDVFPNWLCYIDTVKFNTSLSEQKKCKILQLSGQMYLWQCLLILLLADRVSGLEESEK